MPKGLIYICCDRKINRVFGRGRQIVSSFSLAICGMNCPLNLSFKAVMIGKAQKTNTNLTKLAFNAAKLLFFETRSTSVMIQAMIASSCTREYYKDLMQTKAKL